MVPQYSDQKLQILLVKFKCTDFLLAEAPIMLLESPILLAKWVCLKIWDIPDLMVYHHFPIFSL